MAASTSLIVNTTDTNSKELQKTITNVSSTATDKQCAQFVRALSGLTTNTYINTERVTRDVLDESEIEGE